MTTPVHLHQTVPARPDPARVCRRLRTDGDAFATAATTDAIEVVAPLLDAGGFRARRLPTVTARPPEDDELGCLVVRWDGDEEATGWPAMTLWVVPTPAPEGGTRLGLLSPRHPGYDVSTNRVDKLWRDRLARAAVRMFATSLARALDGDRSATTRVAATTTS